MRVEYRGAPQLRPLRGNGYRGNLKKLFIGHIPKAFGEADVYNFLSQYAPIRELTMIRDSKTNEPRGICIGFLRFLGCAFAYVDTDEIALSLIGQLNNRVRLEGVETAMWRDE